MLFDTILEATEPFIMSGSSIVSHVAHDMRSRALSPRGSLPRMPNANFISPMLFSERGGTPKVVFVTCFDTNVPPIVPIVTLDYLGHWSDEHPAHRQVDALIDGLDALWNHATRATHENLSRQHAGASS